MVDFLTGLLQFLVTVFDFFGILFTDIKIVIGIILNPYLFLMVIFTIAHIYVLLMSQTRKRIIVNYFVFFQKTANGIYNVIVAIILTISAILSNIASVLQSVITAPGIVILGNSVPVGAVFAVILALIVAVYLVF